MEITLTAENFEKEIAGATLPILVDFWAPWCGPCLIIAPTLSQMARDYQGRLLVGKLNVDENPQIAEAYQVRSIPNLKLFKNGKIMDEIIGTLPAVELKKRVEQHISARIINRKDFKR